jgi:hypothetical protein
MCRAALSMGHKLRQIALQFGKTLVVPVLAIFLVTPIQFVLQGCGLGSDRVAGTSSGVDNPQLTVAFIDSNGGMQRVTGTLSLYREDQNPALDIQPLASLKLENTTFVNLSGLDFDRNSHQALTKMMASVTAALDTTVKFNILLRTDGQQGALAIGLTYDGNKHSFAYSNDSTLKRFELIPKPLRKVQATLAHNLKGTGPDRIFIPGTPYLAVLVDSVFEIDDVPEGSFALKVLTGEGKIVSVLQQLDPKKPGHFETNETEDTHPTQPGPEIPLFQVKAGEDQSASLNATVLLEATTEGIKVNDERISWLWHQIEGPHSGANLKAPTKPSTRVEFTEAGTYQFEVAATAGTQLHRDTVLIIVEANTQPEVRFLSPTLGEVLFVDSSVHISWSDTQEQAVHLLISIDSGSHFHTIDKGEVHSKNGPTDFSWKISADIAETENAFLMITTLAGDTLALSNRFIIRKAATDKKTNSDSIPVN